MAESVLALSAPTTESPPSGLHSPPDSNAHKESGSDSELSDLEPDFDRIHDPESDFANEPVLEPGPETKIDLEPAYIDGGVPVFKPTWDQMQDFEKYISGINHLGKQTGIVKVIPPREWLDNQPSLHEEVKKIRIKNPYVQEMNQETKGTSGNFRQLNLSSNRTYNLPQWRELCDQPNRQPPAKRGEIRKIRNPPKSKHKKQEIGEPVDEDEAFPAGRMGSKVKGKSAAISVSSRRKNNGTDSCIIDEKAFEGFDYHLKEEFDEVRCAELEHAYWKSLSYAPPLYGGDMPGTLFTDKTKVWNLASLPGLLNLLDGKVPGVNTTYLYLGSWKATFSWHLEDVDLFSINYLHFGAPKQWYSIPQSQRIKFEKAMATKWPREFKDCSQFLRHKTFQMSPTALLKDYKIKVNKTVHRPGEFVITFPHGYHAGYNLGYNCAEAVNFATEEWLNDFAENARRCECAQAQESVWIDVNAIRRKLPPTHKKFLQGPTEDEFYTELDDDDDDEDDEGVGGPKDMPTPPHSGSEVKSSVPRKRKRQLTKLKDRPVKRRVGMKLMTSEPCILCPNNHPQMEILKTDTGKQAHRVCGEYLPETSVHNGIVQDVNFIAGARMGMKCIYCRSKKGACFQCSTIKCTRAYHATCAAAAGVQVQKIWTASFAQDGTEYKEEAFDFRCRFHRSKRDKKLETALGDDERLKKFGALLKVGEICQIQFFRQEIFAGFVVENRLEEEIVAIKVIFDETGTLLEVDYRWLLVPSSESSLPKPSPNAIPMPKSFKAKESLNTSKRQVDDTPRPHDSFGEKLTWAEFVSPAITGNPAQVKLDLMKENQVWYYLGKISTEAKARFTEDVTKSRDNPNGNFLNSLPKPASALNKHSFAATYSSHRAGGAMLSRPAPVAKIASTASVIGNPNEKLHHYQPLQNSYPQSGSTLSASVSYCQPNHTSSNQRSASHLVDTDHRYLADSHTSCDPGSSAKQSEIINQPNQTNPPNFSRFQKSTPLLLTQPTRPTSSISGCTTVDGSHSHSITGPSHFISAEPSSPQQCQQHQAYSPHQPVTKPVPSKSCGSKLHALSPFLKYKYLQVEHNKDGRQYKTPYRVGGGFMNGYEGSLDNLKKHCQIVGLNNIALAPLPISSAASPIIPVADMGAQTPLHPAIRQQYQLHKITGHAPNVTMHRDPVDSPSPTVYEGRPNEHKDGAEYQLQAPVSHYDKEPRLHRPRDSHVPARAIDPSQKMLPKRPPEPGSQKCSSFDSFTDFQHQKHLQMTQITTCDNSQPFCRSQNDSTSETYPEEYDAAKGGFLTHVSDVRGVSTAEADSAATLAHSHPLEHQSAAQNRKLPSSRAATLCGPVSNFSSLHSHGSTEPRPLPHLSANMTAMFPDVPADTTTLIERMMTNLKKAADLSNGIPRA